MQAERDVKGGRLPAHTGLFYGGSWHEPLTGERVDTLNPATGQVIATVAWAGPADVDRAVAAAHAGHREWRRTTPLQRTRALQELAARLRRHTDELAWLDAADAGMPLSEVRRDVEIAATAIEFCAGLTTEIKGATMPAGAGEFNYTLREPLGVVARIVAFNHPLMFAASRAAAPLAAGNSLILKPSEQSPLSALLLAELAAGIFPPGVLNVLPGGRACGEALVASPGVAKVSLIGSVPTGKAVLRGAAETAKEVALELGGKNALIGFPDADPDAVADAVFRGMNFPWCGQSCGSTSRAFLHDDIHDAVLAKVVGRCRDLTPGLPTAPETAMGCLISMAHRERVDAHVRGAVAQGAKLETGGAAPEDPSLAAGAFYRATVLSRVRPDMRIAREEVFGPVLSVFRWSDREEMLNAVNDTDFGLTASIWTNDIDIAHSVLERLEVGYVWVNNVGSHIYGAPFGGRKQSGIGREESIDELLAYTAIKNVNIKMKRRDGGASG